MKNWQHWQYHGLFGFAKRAGGDKETPGWDWSKNWSSEGFSEIRAITWHPALCHITDPGSATGEMFLKSFSMLSISCFSSSSYISLKFGDFIRTISAFLCLCEREEINKRKLACLKEKLIQSDHTGSEKFENSVFTLKSSTLISWRNLDMSRIER